MRISRSEVLRTALRPASAVWGVVSRSRNLMYDHGIATVRRLPVPVVSIGNITAGGTGKTPTAIHLSRRLLDSGVRPLVLSRGYRSKGYGTRIVSDGKRVLLDAEEAGDEPVMIAHSVPGLPVVVDPDRIRGGYAAVRRFSPDIVLLDDGFQHRRLGRDLDLVLLDAVDPFGRYALLPSGFLREPFSGLVRADLFLITHAPEGEALGTLTTVLRRYNPGAPILRASYKPESLMPMAAFLPSEAPEDGTGAVQGGPSPLPAAVLEGAAVFAFCGVGNPEGFRSTLMTAGARLVGFESFRDHHRFTIPEIIALAAAASRSGATYIVTTEKDAARIARRPEASTFHALRILMDIPEAGKLLEAVRRLLRP